jgi:hypothetical protein
MGMLNFVKFIGKGISREGHHRQNDVFVYFVAQWKEIQIRPVLENAKLFALESAAHQISLTGNDACSLSE